VSALQCVLQLSPSTACDGSMSAFAALTFAVHTCGFFLGSAVLAWWHSDHPLVGFFTRPYARTGRRWRWLWVVPHRFARKLWFALLLAGWPFSDPGRSSSLALLVFASLLAQLALSLWLRPYADTCDNQLEVACLLLLAYGYFVSVLPGSSSGMDASVTALQAALVVYGAQRWLRQRLSSIDPASSSAITESRASGDVGPRRVSDPDSPLDVEFDAPRAAVANKTQQPGSADSSKELIVPLMSMGPHGVDSHVYCDDTNAVDA
jgi:hypothetical protein